jgi:HEAT repeat protein
MNLRDLLSGKPNVERLMKKRKTHALIQALRHSDKGIRAEAASALGKVGDSSAVEALLAALNDAQATVRREAAVSLGKLGDRRAVDALIPLLEKEEDFYRRFVIDALGELGDPRAIPAIAPFLKNRNHELRVDAKNALYGLGPAALQPLLEAARDPESMGLTDMLFSSFRWEVRDQLERLASSEDAQVRELVFKLLGGVRNLDKFLSKYLQDSNPAVRSAARAILDADAPPKPTHPVILGLMSERPDERREAADRLVALWVDGEDRFARNDAFDALYSAIHNGFLKNEPVLANAVRLAIKGGYRRRVEVVRLITLLASDLEDRRGYELLRAAQAGNEAAVEGILAEF